ncbi:MAG TPA: hypothetical protein VEI97_10410 [bacterium]|nr:hypothetical protein [bacterium]
MAVAEYLLVRGTYDTSDPYPMQGIELAQVADQFGLRQAPRLQLHPDDFGWEIVRPGDGITLAEVVYHPALLPERIVVRTPEGGDLKIGFDLAVQLGAQLGANVFNRTTGEEIAHHFPGQTAAQQAAQAQAAARKGCLFGLLAGFIR